MSQRSRDSPTARRRTDLSRPDDLNYAAAPPRICAASAAPSRAGNAGGGVPPPLHVRGVPGGASPDPIGAGGRAAGDEGEEVDGASTADQRRLLLVVAAREGVERGEGSCAGGIRSGVQIQKREVCPNLQNPGGSRDDELCEKDLLRGVAEGASPDAAISHIAPGVVHTLGEGGRALKRSEEESEMDLFGGALSNKCPAAAGDGRSSSVPVTGVLTGAEEQQGLSEIGGEAGNQRCTFDPGEVREIGSDENGGSWTGNRPGGKFWALGQIDEEGEDACDVEEDQQCPYLATLADAFACAKRGKTKKCKENQRKKERSSRESTRRDAGDSLEKKSTSKSEEVREDAKVELQWGARLLDRVVSEIFQSRRGWATWVPRLKDS